jgi:large subunit ribosomal protein L18
MKVNKKDKRNRLHRKVRAKISGTAVLPRVSVYRSNVHMYAQVIDDAAGKTIFGASDKNFKGVKGTKSEKAEMLGKLVAEQIIKAGIKTALFDRGGFKYHGRIQKVAEGLRAGGVTV